MLFDFSRICQSTAASRLDRGQQKAFRSQQAPKVFVKHADTLPHNAVSVFSRKQFSLIQECADAEQSLPNIPATLN